MTQRATLSDIRAIYYDIIITFVDRRGVVQHVRNSAAQMPNASVDPVIPTNVNIQ